MTRYPRMTQTGIQWGPPVKPPRGRKGYRLCEDLCVFCWRCMELAAAGDLVRCEDRWEWEEDYDVPIPH